jgi:hypothetical protein
VPTYLGNGLVKFTATGDPHSDGSVTVQVEPDGHVAESALLDAMGCSTPGNT